MVYDLPSGMWVTLVGNALTAGTRQFLGLPSVCKLMLLAFGAAPTEGDHGRPAHNIHKGHRSGWGTTDTRQSCGAPLGKVPPSSLYVRQAPWLSRAC